MLIYKDHLYRQAADPQRDEDFRAEANAAYEKLQARLDAGDVEPIDERGDTAERVKDLAGWFVRDLEPGLNVVLRPQKRAQTHGKYFPGGRFRHALITLYNGDAGGDFWTSSLQHQQSILSYAFHRRTFLHEYIHHLDWQRAPDISYGDHKLTEDMTDKEYAAYLSEPAEFNAWFQSYADDIEQELKLFVEKLPSKHWPDHATVAQKFVSWFMRSFQHDGWRIDIIPEKLQRKIQKRLAQMFMHYWRDPAKDAPADLSPIIKDIVEALWNTFHYSVEGYDYMDDPAGVLDRFDRVFGTSEKQFMERAEGELNTHDVALKDLSPGQQLKFKSAMRQLYASLLRERATHEERLNR